jgi:polar amino acid transport system permease protein
MDLRFYVPLSNWQVFLHGALLTLRLMGMSSVLGISVGVIAAFLKSLENRFIGAIVSGYVNLIRNTPFIVQLYFAYFALPTLKINLDPTQTGLLVLTISMGAYSTEVIRGGIASIHHSQIEAGRSLGMKYTQIFRHVILPQAMKAVAPPVSNLVIQFTLASCIVAQISAHDLFYQALMLDNVTFRSFEIYTFAGVVYFMLAQGLQTIFKVANRKIFKTTPPLRLPPTI